MKKKHALIIALSLLCLTGCNSGEISDSSISSESENSTLNSSSTSSSSESSTATSPESSEPEVPAGEPTFLTCPDGTVIYTSQITKYQDSAAYADGSHEQYPLDTFNKETFIDNTPQVVCEGFAYGFIPRYVANVAEAPDKFTELDGIQVYSGEELPPSNEYFKIKTGDKFGSLTVKSAQSIFSNSVACFLPEEAKDIPGVYLTDGEIEYEGEIEMTGCISVMRTEGYFAAGDLWFYPDGNSVSKLPIIQYSFDMDLGLHHSAHSSYGSYGEFDKIVLGNMFDYDIDFDGLEPGDTTVRVKITIKDPVVKSIGGSMNCLGEPVAVEVLR